MKGVGVKAVLWMFVLIIFLFASVKFSTFVADKVRDGATGLLKMVQ